MAIIIGSARADENGKYVNGKPGDQRNGLEVSEQNFYVHKKGWNVLRPKNTIVADKIAKEMHDACANNNIGYSQSDRYGIFNAIKKVKNMSKINYKVNGDCSSTVRSCVYAATGKDVGDFNTANEATVLEKSGLFEKRVRYTNGMKLYAGDVLVSCEKGHTVIVTKGDARSSNVKPTEVTYTKDQFKKDVDAIIGKSSVLPTISKTKNSKHKLVLPIQKYLNSIGYNCGKADGIFGTNSYNAVVKWQKNNKLTADGIIGSNSWKKLLI